MEENVPVITDETTAELNIPSGGQTLLLRRGYAVAVGQFWSADLVGSVMDEYLLFIENGFQFDALVTYLLGGKWFIKKNDIRPPRQEKGGRS